MKRVFISDARICTALGDLEATYAGLMQGKNAIRPIQRGFSGIAATIADLDPPRQTTRLADLVDIVLEPLAPLPDDTLLITATTKSGVDALERHMRGEQPSQETIRAAMPRWLTDHVRQRLSLIHPGLALSAACASSTVALIQGSRAVTFGRARSVLVVCADIVSEFVFRGFAALKALDDRPCRPFDRNRAGLSLGEGAAAICLVCEEEAQRSSHTILGEITGWGQANDAVHVTAPARDGCGLIQAMRTALRRAGLRPEEVGAVHAHGTGTVYNDAMELTAIRAVFGNAAPPVHSIKGAVGHTLAAAGGVETAVSLISLRTKMIPPTVGLEQAEDEAACFVSSQPQTVRSDFILTVNSGFGGINAALTLTTFKGA